MRLIGRWIPLLILTFAGCTRSFQVYDVKELASPQAKLTGDYLFYSLPRTVVTVDVPVTKTVVALEGQCVGAGYADLRQALLLDEPEASLSYKAGKPVIGTRSEPDPTRVYAVDLKMKPFALTGGTFELADNGVLTSAAVSQEDQAFDAVLSLARLGLTAAGAIPIASGAAAAAAADTADNVPAARRVCEQTAKAIADVRTKRIAILSDALRAENTNEAYLTAVLGKLDEVEQALTSRFTGQVNKTVATIQCEWRPDAYDTAEERPHGTPLFSYSDKGGPVAESDAPCVIPSAIIGQNHANTKPVRARILRDGKGSFTEAVQAVARPVDDKPRGFFYLIPAKAIVQVDFDSNARAREIKPLAQLGAVTTLPTLGGAFVRKAGMTPTLNAAGGLQKLVINGEPGGGAALTGASDLVTAVLKAEEDEEKAKAAANDELAKLERERKIIEERQKIAEAEARLAELAAAQGGN